MNMIESIYPPVNRKTCDVSRNPDGSYHWELVALDGTIYEGDAADPTQALGALLHTAISLLGVIDD